MQAYSKCQEMSTQSRGSSVLETNSPSNPKFVVWNQEAGVYLVVPNCNLCVDKCSMRRPLVRYNLYKKLSETVLKQLKIRFIVASWDISKSNNALQ